MNDKMLLTEAAQEVLVEIIESTEPASKKANVALTEGAQDLLMEIIDPEESVFVYNQEYDKIYFDTTKTVDECNEAFPIELGDGKALFSFSCNLKLDDTVIPLDCRIYIARENGQLCMVSGASGVAIYGPLMIYPLVPTATYHWWKGYSARLFDPVYLLTDDSCITKESIASVLPWGAGDPDIQITDMSNFKYLVESDDETFNGIILAPKKLADLDGRCQLVPVA